VTYSTSPLLRKVFHPKGLGLDFKGKLFVFSSLAGKVLISNEKELVSSFSTQVDVVGRQGLRWFWGLTCDFWAEFEEINFCDIVFWFLLLLRQRT